jgi:hypothetical protein
VSMLDSRCFVRAGICVCAISCACK